MSLRRPLLFAALGLGACREPAPLPSAQAEPAAAQSAPAAAAPSAAAAPAPRPSASANPSAYPWLAAADREPRAVDTLRARFAPPAGFVRVQAAPESFGAWLRDLPLAAPETPVRSYDGTTLHPASDRRIAAVVALDVSPADLQQCADTVIRLHAEWRWSHGARNMSYRAAAGVDLPWARWARGERIVQNGASIQWAPASKPAGDHAAFRKYLDAVFAWANTVSLEKQARPVAPDQIRAGDFFILPGNPGHVVLVLDLAKQGGDTVALLGQSFMPAQNAQVLRPSDGGPWFRLDPSKAVDTPFWKPFPWGSLRRLPE